MQTQTVSHRVVAVQFNRSVERIVHLSSAHAAPLGQLLWLHAGHAGGKVGVEIGHFDSLHDLFVIEIQQEWVARNPQGGVFFAACFMHYFEGGEGGSGERERGCRRGGGRLTTRKMGI